VAQQAATVEAQQVIKYKDDGYKDEEDD